MKIFAFYVKAIRHSKNVSGICIEINDDEIDAGKKIIERFEKDIAVRNSSIKIVDSGSITLEDLAKKMKPEVEKLIKEAKVKSDLLDVIKQIPIN